MSSLQIMRGPLKGKNQWDLFIITVSIIFFVISLRWSLIDRSPPRWDESLYLVHATVMNKALVENGMGAFLHELFNFDRGRVCLVPAIGSVSFLLFGVSLDSAMLSLHLCWFILAVGLYGIGKLLFEEETGRISGLFTFVFFGLYNLTTYLTNYYLVEFFLVSAIAISYFFLFMLYDTKSMKWSIFFGLSIAIGALIKVSYIAYVLPALGLWFLLELMEQESPIRPLNRMMVIIIMAILIAGPYYVYNINDLKTMSVWLSSRELADLYGFGDVLSLSTILDYWKTVFVEPILLAVSIISSMVCIYSFTLYRELARGARFKFLALLIWFAIPFLLATFGTIKDPRYMYPATLPLFIGAGTGFALLVRRFRSIGVALLFLFLIIPTYQFLVANDIIERQGVFVDRHVIFSPLPDEREWLSIETVKAIDSTMPLNDDKKRILLLGGNRYYHLNLFRFYSSSQEIDISYYALPYYNPEMSLSDAMDVIRRSPPSGVLYKTGEHWPPFSNKHTEEIVELLSNDDDYRWVDLNITQPDMSRLYLLVHQGPTRVTEP